MGEELEAAIRSALNRDRRAIAKLITLMEDDPKASSKIVQAVYPHTGRAWVVGVTGPPGCGKSTLIASLAKELRRVGKTVGIVAVDPTSAFTGGALLGDRIRMLQLSGDEGVFIRSMATRGALGGLARAAGDAIKLLDSAGMDFVFVETVGAGQGDVEVWGLAYTTVVVLSPGLGDEIQALKAGLMEIGDIFVVNKADLADSDRTARQIRASLTAGKERAGWTPPVLKTVAARDEGVGDVLRWLEEHRRYQEALGLSGKALERARREVVQALMRLFEEEVVAGMAQTGAFKELVEKVARREVDPYTAAAVLMGHRC